MFFLVVLGIVLLVTWWLYRRLVVAPAWGARTLSVSVAASLLVLTALVFTEFGVVDRWLTPTQLRPLAWTGATWLAAWLYLFLALLAVAFASGAVRLRGRLRGADTVGTRRRVNRVGAPLAVAFALGVTAYGVGRAADPQVTTATFDSPRLPASFDGLRVALVTDIHAGAVRDAGFVRRVVERTNAASPDLVVLGGDLIDGEAARFAPEIAPLGELRAPLGVVAVTGNHEMFSREVEPWLATWRTLGITVLGNSAVELSRGGEHITVAGVQDQSGRGSLAPDPQAALRGVDPGGFTLLVAHQPRQAWSVQGRGVDLQLSGHTHGGQLWPGRLLVPLQQPAVDGLHPVGDVPVLTSRGAGAWGPPVRVGADPQIVVVTLHRR